MPLVVHLARRFAGRNEPLNDLVQVGAIGLIKAIDRFEPERGLEFSTYATPTILGEIKRHFRDIGWLIQVPRRAQELQTTLERGPRRAAQELGRAPTVAELAGASRSPRTTSRGAGRRPRPTPACRSTRSPRPARRVPDHPIVGVIDEGLEQVEQRALLRDARRAARARAGDPAAALRRRQDPDRDRRASSGSRRCRCRAWSPAVSLAPAARAELEPSADVLAGRT